MPYLTYLSLVHGIGLDYPVLLARTFTSPFKHQVRYGGLGVDLDLFDRHIARLEQLGYARGAAQLTWPLGRMMLHRGDPNMTALGMDDLSEFRVAIDAFTARLRLEPLREFYARAPDARPPAEIASGYFASAIAKLHAVHVLLFNVDQVQQPPPGRIGAGSWTDHLAPTSAPPKIRAVIERYLQLHLDANLDRPQTVRHARDALRRLVTWMAQAHPEMHTLADLHREHAEEFLRWLGSQTSQHTGAPLSVSFRRSVVTLITRFVTETAAWEWDDIPARVLFSRADIPKINHPLPRFIPEHELAALMTAVDQLADPYQRAALIVARWSGARRDEIRRLAVDCLDAYPDGHPRLRIPVGKGYAERMIPLHPLAAEALRAVIDLARQQRARGRFDPSAGRPVQHVFVVRGKLLSNAFLFDLSLKAACTAAGLVDSAGRPAGHHRAPLQTHHRHPTRRRRRPHPNNHGRARAPHSEHVDHLLDPVRRHRQTAVPERPRPPPRPGHHPRRPSRRRPTRTPPRPRSRVLAADQLPQDRTRTRPLPTHPGRGPVRMRSDADVLEIPHHQQLHPTTHSATPRRATAHRRRRRPRSAA